MLNVFRSMTNEELQDERRALRAEMAKLERKGRMKDEYQRERLKNIRKYMHLIDQVIGERYVQPKLL